MPEKHLEAKLRKEIIKRGGKCWKFNSLGTKGVPDRAIYLPGGRHYLVETKYGRNGLSVHQQARLRELAAIGTKVWVIGDDTALKEFLSFVDNEI